MITHQPYFIINNGYRHIIESYIYLYSSIYARLSLYSMEPLSNEFLRGTLKTIVLKLLAEPRSSRAECSGPTTARPGRMYGYEITQAVKERTQGEITLSFGALYPVLHKLEQEGLLTTESEEVEGRLRKYYSLTPQGTEVAVQKISDFERFMDTMRNLLQLPAHLATSH